MSEQPTFDTHLQELAEARARRDSGQQHAEWALDSRWRVAAEEVIADLARDGVEFTADDVTDRIGPALGSATGGMGAMFRKMVTAGVIECVGYRQSRRVERHGSVVRVWRGAS